MARGKPFRTNINHLIKAGVVRKPVWADIVEATRPPFEPVRATKTERVTYPEDRLRAKYLERNPEVRRIPVNLKARTLEERHIADRFISIQLRLIQEKNMTEEDAYTTAHDIINLRTDDANMSADDLSSPLSNSSIQNESARLYLASVRDSERDKKLREIFLEQSAPSTSL